MSTKLLTYLFLMMGGIFVTAQVSFEAVADKTQLNAGDRLQISFVITAENDINISNVVLPNFKGFQILGRNSGTNISYSNGQLTRQYVETVVLFVQKPGKYVLEPAKVKIDDAVYESNSITIKVSKNHRQEKAARTQSNVQMALILSKDEVYPNQPIIADVKLYAKSYDLLRRRSEIEVPGISGFQVIQLSKNQERNFQQQVIDGVVYVSEDIAQFQLMPTQTGQIKIPAFKIRLAIPIDLFDEKIVLLKTKPLIVNVKDLPHNAPASFTGAVGNFKLNAILDDTQLEVEQATNYEIELIGEGNFSSIKLPELKLSKDLEIYPPKRRNAYKTTATGEKGKIVDRYIIVPQNGGQYTIPPFTFTFFNPETEEYETITTAAQEIDVKGNPVSQNQLLADTVNLVNDSTPDTLSNNTVQRINNKVKDIITIPDLPQFNNQEKSNKNWYWFLFIPVLGILLFFYLRHKKNKKTDIQDGLNSLDKKEIIADLKNLLEQLEIAKNHKKEQEFTTISSTILNKIVTLFASKKEDIIYNESQASELLSQRMSDTFIQRWETLHRKNQLRRYSGVSTDDSLEDLYLEYQQMVNDSIKKS
ncbi:hypothetical protein GO491_00610 [Flavobacteriaceae bacterium Ap0902]|nr:hypothetical protein [Flavobacteriaceae bacterium Ap0902]